jgi:hypothetical protein
MQMFAVNILGPRRGIKETFLFDDESKAVEKQYALEDAGKAVEFVNLKFFPNRRKKT